MDAQAGQGGAPPSMDSRIEVAIIGAGPAGLAAGAALRARGISSLLIDKAADVGSTWRAHYERLHLHTERALSGLPGLPIPRAYGKWVARADVVRYLEEYANHHQLKLRLGTSVSRIDRAQGGFAVITPSGPIAARSVIVASGYNHTPYLPDWPGRSTFAGELIHSASYKNAAPYAGQDALVVGTGNSGSEIAVDLVEGGAKSVRVAVRTPPNIVLREVGGVSTQRLGVVLRRLPARLVDVFAGAVQKLTVGDLRPYGLQPSPRGIYTRAAEGQIPILDVGFVAALKARRLSVVPPVEALDGSDVLLQGGQRLRPDVIVAATGYRRALEGLVGHLDVLDARGLPAAHGAASPPSAPGLYFIGYTNPVSGNLRELAIDARKIARRLAKAG